MSNVAGEVPISQENSDQPKEQIDNNVSTNSYQTSGKGPYTREFESSLEELKEAREAYKRQVAKTNERFGIDNNSSPDGVANKRPRNYIQEDLELVAKREKEIEEQMQQNQDARNGSHDEAYFNIRSNELSLQQERVTAKKQELRAEERVYLVEDAQQIITDILNRFDIQKVTRACLSPHATQSQDFGIFTEILFGLVDGSVYDAEDIDINALLRLQKACEQGVLGDITNDTFHADTQEDIQQTKEDLVSELTEIPDIFARSADLIGTYRYLSSDQEALFQDINNFYTPEKVLQLTVHLKQESPVRDPLLITNMQLLIRAQLNMLRMQGLYPHTPETEEAYYAAQREVIPTILDDLPIHEPSLRVGEQRVITAEDIRNFLTKHFPPSFFNDLTAISIEKPQSTTLRLKDAIGLYIEAERKIYTFMQTTKLRMPKWLQRKFSTGNPTAYMSTIAHEVGHHAHSSILSVDELSRLEQAHHKDGMWLEKYVNRDDISNRKEYIGITFSLFSTAPVLLRTISPHLYNEIRTILLQRVSPQERNLWEKKFDSAFTPQASEGNPDPEVIKAKYFHQLENERRLQEQEKQFYLSSKRKAIR